MIHPAVLPVSVHNGSVIAPAKGATDLGQRELWQFIHTPSHRDHSRSGNAPASAGPNHLIQRDIVSPAFLQLDASNGS
jgi:hypothetical protein